MQKLFQQIIRFSFVGGLCFVIDYMIGLVVLNVLLVFFSESYFESASIIGSVIGFIASIIANYILSFKFVFERKDNIDKKAEFLIFVLLSVIGLFINSFIIWLAVGPVYRSIGFLHENVGYNMIYTAAKIAATAIVMIYNFVTRKLFLEKR